MHGGVAGAAKVVKERPLRRADDVAARREIDERLLRVLGVREETDLGGRSLREDLTELAELEEADGRIGREVLLRLRRERDEPRVVVREVREVGGGGWGHRHRASVALGSEGRLMCIVSTNWAAGSIGPRLSQRWHFRPSLASAGHANAPQSSSDDRGLTRTRRRTGHRPVPVRHGATGVPDWGGESNAAPRVARWSARTPTGRAPRRAPSSNALEGQAWISRRRSPTSLVTTTARSRLATRTTDASITSEVPARPQRTPAASARTWSSAGTTVVGPFTSARSGACRDAPRHT